MKRSLSLFFSILLFVSFAKAQQSADVTITLNEKFFDALFDAVFTNLQNPSFPLAMQIEEKQANERTEISMLKQTHTDKNKPDFLKTNYKNFETEDLFCDESIRLMREIDGVRTAVRFRDGRISAPIAFSGSYNPPLVGCINFQGWADSTIELEFNQNSQTLIGRARVNDVRLSGTGGIGSSLITKLVQSSIDKKINPIQILQMEKVSFVVPVQNSGSLRMKAVGMRHEIVNGAMNVHITYQFLKAQ